MKVRITREVQVDIETNITREEIIAGLQESLENAQQICNPDFLSHDRQKMIAVHHFASDTINCLVAIDDNMIALARLHVCELVVKHLREQADRWERIHKPSQKE